MYITEIEELAHEAEDIQLYLQSEIPDDGSQLVDRTKALGVYLARTGKMLADAKYHLSGKKRTDDRRVEQLLVDWIDRLNNTCGRQLEACRTLISKNKEEMKFYGNPGKECG